MKHKLPKGYMIQGGYREDDYTCSSSSYWLTLFRYQRKRWFRKEGWRPIARTRVGYSDHPPTSKKVRAELIRFAVAREAARG